MPFIGSIPLPVRQILSEHAELWRTREVYVGCSGNFTVERVLAVEGRFSLHSNDVALYTSALGAYFSGQSLQVSINADYAEKFSWLDPYLRSPLDTAATIMLSTRLMETIALDGGGSTQRLLCTGE